MKGIIESAAEESKELLRPIYEDAVQPAVREVGTTLGRVLHALLFPVRGLCWGYEKIEKVVVSGLEKKLEKVPKEKLHTPEPEIAVPIMQTLTYTAHNDTLRELYINLLANAMNSDYDKAVHNSYVEVIKQMNRLDVLVFRNLSESEGCNMEIISPRVDIKGTKKHYINATPKWFIGWTVEEFDIFDISTCIVRLMRLGLIEIDYNVQVANMDYNELIKSPLITSIFHRYVSEYPNEELELTTVKSLFYVNEYGQRFAKACL